MPSLTVQTQVAHLFEHENLAVYSDANETSTASGLEHVSVLTLLTTNLGRHQGDSAAFFQTHD